ncbi:MAG: hypothetical protein ABI883_08335 [Chthoniobacterales bacterium]
MTPSGLFDEAAHTEMAWRLHEHVLRGEIDNQVRGRVTGRIWLAGIDEPLVLDLTGDCEPDIAGSLLRFENHNPLPFTTAPPALRQRGEVGFLSAARKVRVVDVPVEEALAMERRGETPPEHMANALYLEWYSPRSGRVVIESSDYRLQVSPPAWSFAPEEIEARAQAAAAAESPPFPLEVDAEGEGEVWDEFRCEQLLREGDSKTDRFRKLLERYHDHPDCERIVAREMGWDWVGEALDEQAAASDQSESEEEETADADSEAGREQSDWIRTGEREESHPIAQRAHDALFQLIDEQRATQGLSQPAKDALQDLLDSFMAIAAKLAGALEGVTRGSRTAENYGLTIAFLKRVLQFLHEALAATDRAAAAAALPAARITFYRGELFGLREEIIALITELRAD